MKWKFSASRSKGGSAGKRLDRMNKTNLMGSVMLGYFVRLFANPERTRILLLCVELIAVAAKMFSLMI